MDLDERNIGGGYNTMRLLVFFKECMVAVIEIVDWLYNSVCGGGGLGFPVYLYVTSCDTQSLYIDVVNGITRETYTSIELIAILSL